MLEIINKLLQGEVIQYVLVGLIVCNAILSSLAQGLALIGKSQKLPVWVYTIALGLRKVIDFVSGNIAHK